MMLKTDGEKRGPEFLAVVLQHVIFSLSPQNARANSGRSVEKRKERICGTGMNADWDLASKYQWKERRGSPSQPSDPNVSPLFFQPHLLSTSSSPGSGSFGHVSPLRLGESWWGSWSRIREEGCRQSAYSVWAECSYRKPEPGILRRVRDDSQNDCHSCQKAYFLFVLTFLFPLLSHTLCVYVTWILVLTVHGTSLRAERSWCTREHVCLILLLMLNRSDNRLAFCQNAILKTQAGKESGDKYSLYPVLSLSSLTSSSPVLRPNVSVVIKETDTPHIESRGSEMMILLFLRWERECDGHPTSELRGVRKSNVKRVCVVWVRVAHEWKQGYIR